MPVMLLSALIVAAQPAASPPVVPAPSSPAPAKPSQSDGVNVTDEGGIGSQPATSAEIADGIGDCVAYVHQHGKVDFDKFMASGWKSGGKAERPARGMMPKTVQVYLGKGNVVSIITLTGLSASCQTVASVTELKVADAEVRTAIGQRFKALPAKDYKGDEFFKKFVTSMAGGLDKVMISDGNRFIIEQKSSGGKSILDVMMTPRITK